MPDSVVVPLKGLSLEMKSEVATAVIQVIEKAEASALPLEVKKEFIKLLSRCSEQIGDWLAQGWAFAEGKLRELFNQSDLLAPYLEELIKFFDNLPF